MATLKKLSNSAASLDLSMNDRACSGVSPVNKQGQVTDKSGKEVNWPVTPSNMKNVSGVPSSKNLENNPGAY